MRILFLPLITRGTAIGTITRCLSIADHLTTLGHDVLFLTNGEGAKLVAEAGYKAFKGVEPDPAESSQPLKDLSDVAVHLHLTGKEYLKRALKAEQDAVDRFKPDVLMSEFKLTAAITAEANRLPLVSTACSPADVRFRSPLFPGSESRSDAHAEAVQGFNEILGELGQRPIQDVAELFFSRSTVKTAPTIRELEPLLADVPDIHYIGYLLYNKMELASLPEKLLDVTQGRSIVFCYFSTGEIGPDQYAHVLPKAFDGTDFHAVCAVGDHPDMPELPSASQNVTWVRFVPGRSILRRSQAVVFHGGQNTAMAALIHQVPALVCPGSDFERDFNARSLTSLGVAIHMQTADFTPTNVRDAVFELQKHSYRNAAEEYSRKILHQGGPQYAAELIVKTGTDNPHQNQ